MYIEAVPNRDSPPAILLRESYREAGKVRQVFMPDVLPATLVALFVACSSCCNPWHRGQLDAVLPVDRKALVDAGI